MPKNLPSFSPTLKKVLEIMPLNKAVTPVEINDYIGRGNYASKHVLYLRLLGYEFDTVKTGRNVVSYTLIKIPASKTATAPVVAVEPKIESPKKVVKPAKKSIAEIKAKNLAKLKEVGGRVNKETVKSFISDEWDSNFSVIEDWDSIDSLDLSKLV